MLWSKLARVDSMHYELPPTIQLSPILHIYITSHGGDNATMREGRHGTSTVIARLRALLS